MAIQITYMIESSPTGDYHILKSIYIKIYIRQRVCNNHLSVCSTVEYSGFPFSLLICFQRSGNIENIVLEYIDRSIFIDIWLFLNDCFAIDRLLDGRLIEKDELFRDYYSILFFNSIPPPYVEYSLDLEKICSNEIWKDAKDPRLFLF